MKVMKRIIIKLIMGCKLGAKEHIRGMLKRTGGSMSTMNVQFLEKNVKFSKL